MYNPTFSYFISEYTSNVSNEYVPTLNEYQINKEFIVKNCDTSKKSDILQLLNSNKVLDWILIKNNKNDFEI